MLSRAGFLLLAALVPIVPLRASAQIPLRNLELKSHVNEYPPACTGNTNYSACWSYVHHDGREYAAIGVGDGGCSGTDEGTAIYNVTDPAAPYRVAFIPGPPSIWREMKQYRSWIYVVTEGTGPGEGLQIIRMTDPEHPLLAATHSASFSSAHTVSVDTSRALLVCNGTRLNTFYTKMRIFSLADPENPVEIAYWPPFTPANLDEENTYYVHDSAPVGNRLYASSVYHGIQRVLDVTNPALPTQIAAWTYAGGFTHNAWPDKTGNWLYVTDEKNGEPLKIFDISNLSAPALFNTFTPNPAAIVHNAHVWGDELYLANYTEGIRVLDISDPGHPAEYAYADTYAGSSGDFNGVWEVCAQFPSGTIIASDRSSGLWIFRPRRNYGLVRVKVVDAAGGQPLPGARLFLGPDSLTATADGVAVFAADPGSRTVTARRFGYFDASVTRTVTVGSRDTVALALTKRPAVSFTGVIRSAATQAPLEDAELVLAYSPLHDHTDAAGRFGLASVPEGLYRVEVRCPGYIPVTFEREIGPGSASMDFQIVPAAAYEPCESAAGWKLGLGDETASGKWVHVDPVGIGAPTAVLPSSGLPPGAGIGAPRPGGAARFGAMHEGHAEASGVAPGDEVQPEDDRSPSGTMCFVTGQASGSGVVDDNDVDGGRTTLETPAFDMTGMTVPTIAYWRWLYSSTGEPTDYLAVLVSNDNGSTWVPVDTTRGLKGHWEERAVRVADYVSPTTQVKLRFVAADEGGSSVVEAAIDDVSRYDAATQPVGSFPYRGVVPTRLRLRAPWPNPAAGSVRAVVELAATGRVEASVFDLQGRQVAGIFDGLAEAGARVLSWDGRGPGGRPAEAGLYFILARAGGATAAARFVKLR